MKKLIERFKYWWEFKKLERQALKAMKKSKDPFIYPLF